MPINFVENVFKGKKELEASYEVPEGVKVFDLHNKHLLYGRIDKEGDAIYLFDNSSLKTLNSGGRGDHMAIDFVCDAFSDFATSVKNTANRGYLSKESIIPTNMRAFKSQTNGDLPYRYETYLNKIYTTFVDTYLSVDRRKEKIKNYNDFIKHFMRFFIKTASSFPFTRTGFITSIHCSPFVSGLMLEVSAERHGLKSNERAQQYLLDRNFTFFINESRKFGFMVDKNAPWRLVFNIQSGVNYKETNDLRGGQIYMNERAMNSDNVLKTYFRKAYLDELINLKNQLYNFYESFYFQYATYQEIQYPEYSIRSELTDSCAPLKIKTETKQRTPPPMENLNDLYWLNVLLLFRLAETKTDYDNQSFNFFYSQAKQRYDLFGVESALKYINDLTRGKKVSKFITKGAYWYGISDKEYNQRLFEARENVLNPDRVDYSITRNGNFK